MRLSPLLAAAFALTAGPGLAPAADVDRGARLHEQECAGCHASRFDGGPTAIYTRNDRKVRSLKGLRAQVDRCVDNLGLDWGPARQGDVVAFLNANYYRF
ncbi:MAG TPA: cytochrome c [Gammaproteobacteria bacterium]|nr:cytochrome c [Gammaproteobacteria bacterium]